MRQHRLLCCCLTLLPLSGSPAAEPEPVGLVFTPVLKPESSEFAALDVALHFAGDSDGETEVELPSEWGGFNALYKQLGNITAEGATVTAGSSPDKILLRHKPDAAITLRYRVSGVPRPDQVQGRDAVNEYRPIINATYFHVLGNAVVASPTHLDGDAPARFRIEGLPEGAVFASDMQHGDMGRALTFSDLIESVSVGGDFRVIDAGNGARLAIRSAVDSRDDAGWVKAYGDVAHAITRYWESEAGPYLVTILPFAPANDVSVSVGGTGRSDAFAFFVTRNAPPETIDLIMSHEMGHSWVPRRIGVIKDGPDQSQQYWLSEGFTDFTTWRAMVRAGLWTPEQYVTQWNEALAEYNTLAIHKMPNVESAKLFWTSNEGQRLPYLRGALFASWLDDELRHLKRPTTLRNLLLEMQARAASASYEALEREGFAPGLLRSASAKAGLKLKGAIASYIDKGEPVPFGAQFMAACGAMESIRRAKFHRGFDIEASVKNGNIISGVIEGGPAWKAGLRDGMKLVRRSGGEVGDSTVEIAYDVVDDGVAKTLRWMPEGEGEEVLRRLVLDPAKTEGCKAYLSN